MKLATKDSDAFKKRPQSHKGFREVLAKAPGSPKRQSGPAMNRSARPNRTGTRRGRDSHLAARATRAVLTMYLLMHKPVSGRANITYFSKGKSRIKTGGFQTIPANTLVPYLESPVTYYAAQTDSRDEFESLCNKPERSFLVNFHSK
ncbi:MAG: hypothetical protein ABSC19_01215, partial [Syntrophorhabdales bacterium]